MAVEIRQLPDLLGEQIGRCVANDLRERLFLPGMRKLLDAKTAERHNHPEKEERDSA